MPMVGHTKEDGDLGGATDAANLFLAMATLMMGIGSTTAATGTAGPHAQALCPTRPERLTRQLPGLYTTAAAVCTLGVGETAFVTAKASKPLGGGQKQPALPTGEACQG